MVVVVDSHRCSHATGRDKDQQLRVSLLEKRVAELEASERELLARIQEMEQAAVRGEPSADGRMSRKISSIISKKSQADKKMTISFRNVVVTERLASVGGSNAGVFSCYVDGTCVFALSLSLSLSLSLTPPLL